MTYTSFRFAYRAISRSITSFIIFRCRSLSAIGIPSESGYSTSAGAAFFMVAIARPPCQSPDLPEPASFFHSWILRYKVRSPMPSRFAASSRLPRVSSSAFSM